MGLSSYVTQLAFVTIFLIITNLCLVTTNDSNTPDNNNATNVTTNMSMSTTTDLNGTMDLSSSTVISEDPTDAITSTSPLNNTYYNTTDIPSYRPTFWTSGLVVFCGVGVLALLVVFVLIPLVSITMDRFYYGRKRESYTLNRTDRIGAPLQRMASGLHFELQGDASVEDDSLLMMPEQAVPEPAQPVGAVQTTHLLVEDAPSPCGENQAANGHYEECKFARASAESLDRLVDMGNLDVSKVVIQSSHDAEALRYRFYSADPSSSTNQQKPTRFYSNPDRERKCGYTLPDAPADSLISNISTTGMDDLRVADCSATPFVREESVDMYGADSPASADCKNESFIHSPSASAVVKYHEKMEKPVNALPSGPHVYEELKDMRSVKEATTSEEKGAASPRDACKITFPQYFQLNTRDIEEARAAAGYVKPRTAQTLPRQDVPHSLALLSASPLDEFAGGGDNASPVIARRGTGIMAAMNRQHRLSDGALDKANQVHETNPYSSLHRQNVPNLKSYSKLNRAPSAGSPKTPSLNVYDKLKLAGDCEFTGQGSQLHETKL